MGREQDAVRSGQRDAGCEPEESEFSSPPKEPRLVEERLHFQKGPAAGVDRLSAAQEAACERAGRENVENGFCTSDGCVREPLGPLGKSAAGTGHRRILRRFPGLRFLSHPVLTLVLILLLLVLLAVTVALAVRSAPQVPVPCAPPPEALGCPSGWVGYSGVCYYFSVDEGTWDQAQERCSELGASLAIVRDEELDLLFRLCRNVDFWVGLRRRDGRLQWGDGSSFSSSVPVLGNSQCVFLADGAFRSESCSHRRPYLCSKAAAPLGQGLQKGSSPLRAVPAPAPGPA